MAAVVDAAVSGERPILSVFMGADAPPLAAEATGAPRFAAPEEAVRALRRAVDHARRRARPPDDREPLDGVESDRAAAIVASGLGGGGGWLPPAQVAALLRCYGIRTDASHTAGAGTELLLGIAGDPRLGPLVALAAGGEEAELVADVEVRLAPIGPQEADGMISGLRSFPLLDGSRGRPRADIAALRDAVIRVGALAAEQPELAELDCNPLVAGPAGAVVVESRARLEPAPPRRPYAALGRP